MHYFPFLPLFLLSLTWLLLQHPTMIPLMSSGRTGNHAISARDARRKPLKMWKDCTVHRRGRARLPSSPHASAVVRLGRSLSSKASGSEEARLCSEVPLREQSIMLI